MASALGVICLGESSENACFWDGAGIETNAQFRIQDVLNGGREMPANGGGGDCTDCHAGQNPFIVHPESSALNLAGFNTNSDWYTPIDVHPSWKRNPPATATLLNNVDTSYNGAWGAKKDGESCIQCHQLPEVSELDLYCESVLKQAARNTMPSENNTAGWSWPNSSEFRKHIKALRNACP